MFEDDGISLGSESYFNYSPPKPSPMVRLSAKIAKSRHDGETQKRQADDAALPFILKDMQDKERAAIQKAQAIEQQITQTQQSLQQPMPTMQAAQMTQAEMIAALVSSLVDPRGTQGYIGTGQQMAGQRAEMDYENQTRQYGIQRQDNQNALEFLQRQLGQQQGIAANYEQMGMQTQYDEYKDQRNADQALTLEDKRIQGRADLAGTKANNDLLKTRLSGAYKMMGSSSAEIRQAGYLGLLDLTRQYPELANDPEVMNQMQGFLSQRTVQEADTKDKTLDRQMTRPLRMKKVQSDIDASISRAKLNDENRRLIGIKADYYDDEFALKKWDREIKAENARIYRQNVESLAATRGLADPSALRQALNSERLVISELLSLNQAQLKSKPGDAGLIAEQADLKAQLYDINQRMNPERSGQLGGGLDQLGGDVAPFNPMGGGVELRGSIGGGGASKPVPGKPKPQPKKAQPKKPNPRASGWKIEIER